MDSLIVFHEGITYAIRKLCPNSGGRNETLENFTSWGIARNNRNLFCNMNSSYCEGSHLLYNNQIAWVGLSFDCMPKTTTTTKNTSSIIPSFHIRIGRVDPSRNLYCYIHKYFPPPTPQTPLEGKVIACVWVNTPLFQFSLLSYLQGWQIWMQPSNIQW